MKRLQLVNKRPYVWHISNSRTQDVKDSGNTHLVFMIYLFSVLYFYDSAPW